MMTEREREEYEEAKQLLFRSDRAKSIHTETEECALRLYELGREHERESQRGPSK